VALCGTKSAGAPTIAIGGALPPDVTSAPLKACAVTFMRWCNRVGSRNKRRDALDS